MISVVIPTMSDRTEWYERCKRGYKERTDSEVEIITLRDYPSCSMGWRAGARVATGDYLHFTCDDIVPDYDWDIPCIEACEAGYVPVVGVFWGPKELDEDRMPKRGSGGHKFSFFEDHQVYPDWHKPNENEYYYPSLPFCSMKQWFKISPMISSHYAGDKWFGRQARKAGYWPVVRDKALFYHYVADTSRDNVQDGWLGFDRLTFDQNIAYPMYCSGQLKPEELHPEHDTLKGREMARMWYINNVPRPSEGYPWELNWIPEDCRQ